MSEKMSRGTFVAHVENFTSRVLGQTPHSLRWYGPELEESVDIASDRCGLGFAYRGAEVYVTCQTARGVMPPKDRRVTVSWYSGTYEAGRALAELTWIEVAVKFAAQLEVFIRSLPEVEEGEE